MESSSSRRPPLQEKCILVVGMNPAHQRTLIFERDGLKLGRVNRAQRVITTFGGKGQHAAKAISQLHPGACILLQSGKDICAALSQLPLHQWTFWYSDAEAATRTCTTLIQLPDPSSPDTSRHKTVMTELIDPSPELTAAEYDTIRNPVLDALSSGAVREGLRGVALCGTFPPGIPSALYEGIVQAVAANDAAAGGGTETVIVLDAWKGVLPCLSRQVVHTLKINEEELWDLCGAALPDHLTIKTTSQAAALLIDKCKLHAVAVTAGGKSAALYVSQREGGEGSASSVRLREFDFTLPDIEDRLKNPIGAGDTCTGVYLAELLTHPFTRLGEIDPQWIVDAFRKGLAAASASCLQWTGASFEREDVDALMAQIAVKETAHD
ncbi:unnamed protein product [Vitrella brassicaformis CCMP3155]|uniref:Carbohydrate kinase PfkB domain-containing protein n=2 Tax=Vitrella brassicaformis TaxID=1169539 RepID=A0A0G4EE01_VITBC|nr:unnamed protein product [Vitrella brassicaformis CCMP3155]|eukprot:CEL93790.1 unnamed protein product [Vitrella brassicaformis CCMP3155]